jgi:hypothetical protein
MESKLTGGKGGAILACCRIWRWNNLVGVIKLDEVRAHTVPVWGFRVIGGRPPWVVSPLLPRRGLGREWAVRIRTDHLCSRGSGKGRMATAAGFVPAPQNDSEATLQLSPTADNHGAGKAEPQVMFEPC